ncbi:hypothetical protein WN944_000350 [Citrus x changshan-huyou]|uniref:Uncharacterized protein n=1 Tax=Citrus x changshan-huyou TaxID=2935761 RepID=A0AAP0QLU5_9ROSI
MATWRPLIGFRLLRAVPAHMIWVAGDGVLFPSLKKKQRIRANESFQRTKISFLKLD